MGAKVVLVLVDGMRPDAMLACGHPFAQRLVSMSSHALDAQTVMPSVTLPCHMSLFHSVDPDRHGILTNTYVPQVRPIDGLFDQLGKFGKKNGFFYNWEQLRDLARPGCLKAAFYLNAKYNEDSDRKVTDAAVDFIRGGDFDFTFVYLGLTDNVGHAHGWMTPEQLGAVGTAMECIERIYDAMPEEATLITTADHGGHERSHGTDKPEDMTIPICFCGPAFAADKPLSGVTIKDIAPTVADLLGIPCADDWEGKNVLEA